MAVPPDADAPPPTAPHGADDTPDNPHHCLLKQNFCHHGQHGTGEAAPVLLTAGQHRRHILCNTIKGLRGCTFYLRDIVRGALFPLTPAGLEASIQFPRSWSSAAQVFFCSDMTLFSASGLSPYCSFRRCSVASRSACRSVSPGFSHQWRPVLPVAAVRIYPPAAPARSGAPDT